MSIKTIPPTITRHSAPVCGFTTTNSKCKKETKTIRGKRGEKTTRGKTQDKKIAPNNKGIFNLSKTTLTQPQIEVLGKGFKFAPDQPQNKFETYINLHKLILKLTLTKFFIQSDKGIPLEKQNNINGEFVHTELKEKSKFYPSHLKGPFITAFQKLVEDDFNCIPTNNQHNKSSNLKNKEKRALRELKDNHKLIIKSADKGGGITILDKENYIEMLNRQLRYINTYECLPSDPTKKYQEELLLFHIPAFQRGFLSKAGFDYLYTQFPHIPQEREQYQGSRRVEMSDHLHPDENNQTMVTMFIFLGFQGTQKKRIVLFILFLVIYCVTICGNLLIIALVSYNKNLHSPMYFFLTQLSMNDILLTADIVPNLLYILLNDRGNISFIGCIIQFYLFGASETSECLLLTVMSYDRYLAICNPLHYASIMNSAYCLKLAIISWVLSYSIILLDTITTSMLQFCGPNIIDHFFCDLAPLLEMSCSDTNIVQLQVYVLSAIVVIFPCIIIIASYVNILFTILRIPSNTVRQKAFSTCSSHLAVVSIFFGTLFGVYVLSTKGQSLNISKILSLIYTVVTPLLNPIIYSLRNKDIKNALHKTVHKNIFCGNLVL
ncbi:olfactory receptor 10A7-like [Mixophyes fleayi]|uniref:olfactory receptor 10A7-like n=1 Tax=Mixophyes fleayi TaxID=3061075 RepID=UPI003F4DB9C2